MNTEELIDRLNRLLQLDEDALHAYDAALPHLEPGAIRQQLASFREDHQRHVTELADLVRRYGGSPKLRPDWKGYILKGFTSVTSLMGVESGLSAMRGNEELTNRVYAKTLEEAMPEELSAVVRRNFSDEQRHLSYIQEALRLRLWESQPPAQL